MTALIASARRYPLLGFFTLAYLLSWWPWVWYRIDPVAADAPILPFGPFLAAAIMLGLMGGWPAIRAWLAKIVHWRVGVQWYALVLLLPPAITAMAVGVVLFLGATLPTDAALPSWGDLAARFAFIFLLIGIGEEPAWRGYALPRLIEGRTALAGALILGALHAVWHWPLFGVEYDLGNIVPWAVSVFCVSVIAAWMWLHTGRSLLLPALLHTMVNTAAFPFGWFTGGDLVRLWWVWAALWLAVAAMVVTANGSALIKAKPRRMAA